MAFLDIPPRGIRGFRVLGITALAIAGTGTVLVSPSTAQVSGQPSNSLRPPTRAVSPTSSSEFPVLLPPNTARPGWSHRVDCSNYLGDSVDGVVDGSRIDILNCNGDRPSIGGSSDSSLLNPSSANEQSGATRAIPARVPTPASFNASPVNPLLFRCDAPEVARVRFSEQPDDSAQARDFCGVRAYF